MEGGREVEVASKRTRPGLWGEGLCKVSKGWDLLAARPLGTFGGLQWIGRLGAKKEGVPWKRPECLVRVSLGRAGGEGGGV